MFTGHKMGPPLCGTGNGRDGDKLLCNIYGQFFFGNKGFREFLEYGN